MCTTIHDCRNFAGEINNTRRCARCVLQDTTDDFFVGHKRKYKRREGLQRVECVCVCVSERVRERESGREREGERERAGERERERGREEEREEETVNA